MEKVTIIGVDLAKNVFQLHGAAADGSVVFRKKLSRLQFCKFMAGHPGKRAAEAVQLWYLQGMRASISLFGQPLAMRSRVWVSQACGSTWFILAVASSVAMVAHVRPPPSLPAKKRKRSFPRTWTALATADRFQTDASGQAAAALRKLKGRRSSIATFSGR